MCVCAEILYPNFFADFFVFASVTVVHEYLSATTSSPDAASSLPAPPVLHPSLALSCAHSLPLTLIDTEKHADEVK